jgi:hypothetical protein
VPSPTSARLPRRLGTAPPREQRPHSPWSPRPLRRPSRPGSQHPTALGPRARASSPFRGMLRPALRLSRPPQLRFRPHLPRRPRVPRPHPSLPPMPSRLSRRSSQGSPSSPFPRGSSACTTLSAAPPAGRSQPSSLRPPPRPPLPPSLISSRPFHGGPFPWARPSRSTRWGRGPCTASSPSAHAFRVPRRLRPRRSRRTPLSRTRQQPRPWSAHRPPSSRRTGHRSASLSNSSSRRKEAPTRRRARAVVRAPPRPPPHPPPPPRHPRAAACPPTPSFISCARARCTRPSCGRRSTPSSGAVCTPTRSPSSPNS